MRRFLITVISGLFTFVVSVHGSPFVQSWSSPIESYAVAAQDINNDGKPDVVSVNGDQPGTLTVATNAGNGVFVTNGTYAVGNFPDSVAIADFNGDNKPDSVVANFLDNTLTVLTNAGGGIFVSNATYAAGSGPVFVIATDINGDHKPDLVTANSLDGSLTVLTNGGNGTFSLAQTVLVVNSNSQPQSIAAADINGDGTPDLIAPDYNDGLLLVLTNAGGGTFVSNAVYAGNSPSIVAAVDVNNDNKTDILYDSSSVLILTNAGNGQLISSPAVRIAGSFAVMDVDDDGLVDLYIDNGTFKKTVFNSGGVFLTNNVVSTPGTSIGFPVAIDVNDDGKLDLVGSGSSGLTVLTNDVSNFIQLTTPTNIIVEAAGPSGAVVNFSCKATNWTGALPVTNAPPSGSTFPLGITTVTSSTGYFIKSNLSGSTNGTFTVTMQDTTPPTVALLGVNPVTNFVDSYVEAGATATDTVWGNLTGSIIVSGNLNTNVPGNYTVTYSVTDGSGNTSVTNRTVMVVPLPPLGIASASGNQTALFWPVTDKTNYVLQSTTNLASGNWVDVTNSVPVFAVEVTNSGSTMFFRLKPQ